jgi:aspartate carbamoyltransferase regulatory subunit
MKMVRPNIQRCPNTTPDKCKGHERYLDFVRPLHATASLLKYRCRYCGETLEFIDECRIKTKKKGF